VGVWLKGISRVAGRKKWLCGVSIEGKVPLCGFARGFLEKGG